VRAFVGLNYNNRKCMYRQIPHLPVKMNQQTTSDLHRSEWKIESTSSPYISTPLFSHLSWHHTTHGHYKRMRDKHWSAAEHLNITGANSDSSATSSSYAL